MVTLTKNEDPVMQQEYVDFRSSDRVSGSYANDFTLAMQQGIVKRKTAQVAFSGLEMPSTRYTLEEKENALAIGEGASIGDHSMTKTIHFGTNPNDYILGENEILLSTKDGEHTILTVPPTLMPIEAFATHETSYNSNGSIVTVSSSITTPQRHGLKTFMDWAKSRENVDILLVGGEPHPRAKHYFNAGIRVSDLPALDLSQEKKLLFSPHTVQSMRVGDKTGYLHCPMLHFQEILSLLNHGSQGVYTFEMNDRPNTSHSIVRVVRADEKQFTVRGLVSPQSLMGVLGFQNYLNFRKEQYTKFNPSSLMRIRIPPGFYSNPPSLLANAVERAIQGRCALMATQDTVDGHTFTISLMDATYNQTINVPPGVYTPEKLVDTVQTLMTGVTLSLKHVSDIGYENVGWVQYTFEAEQAFPFVIDFKSKTSALIAFSLGFENRRYSSQTKYVGAAIAVAATRNIAPCPPVTEVDSAELRAPLVSSTISTRYPHGLYTIIGTTPTTQRFELISEPGKSWAVPNKLKEKTYFNNVEGKGVVDLTTRALQRQVSYDFREGDVVRLTGFHKSEQTFSVAAQSLSGPTGKSEITDVYSDILGGRGYSRTPTLRLDGELVRPKEISVSHIALSNYAAEHVLRISRVYAPVSATALKSMTSNGDIIATLTNLYLSPNFDVDFQENLNACVLRVVETNDSNETAYFRYTHGEFTVTPHAQTKSHTIAVPVWRPTETNHLGDITESNEISVNITFDLYGAETDFSVQENTPITFDTWRGPFTATPVDVVPKSSNFCFTFRSDIEVHPDLTGERVVHPGYATLMIVERVPALHFRLLRSDLQSGNNTLTFEKNLLNLDTCEVVELQEETNAIRTTVPDGMTRSARMITQFPEFVYLSENMEYGFRMTDAKIDGVLLAAHEAYRAVLGDHTYSGQSAAETLAVVLGDYQGLYTLDSQPYNTFVYTGANFCVYLYQPGASQQGAWRVCTVADVAVYANTASALYGGGVVLVEGLNVDELFDSGSFNTSAWHFSETILVSGTLVTMKDSTPFSKELITTALRPTGMVHPSITPVLLNDRVICYNVTDDSEALYLYPPSITVCNPSQKPYENDPQVEIKNTVTDISVQQVDHPSRLILALTLAVFPPELTVSNLGEYGFVAILSAEDTTIPDRSLVVVDADPDTKKVIVSYDFYEPIQPAWIQSVHSFRVSPGRAIHINHTTLDQQANYCLSSMPDLIARQQFWGQELPLRYSGVVPVNQGFVENIKTISITGTQIVLATSVTYDNNANTLDILEIEPRHNKGAFSVRNIDGRISVLLENVDNLYVQDHVTLGDDIVSNAKIVDIDSDSRTVLLDVDPSTTPYWHAEEVLLENTRLYIDTRKVTLNGTFDQATLSRGNVLYLSGSSHDAGLSQTDVISGMYALDRFSGFINTTTSHIYINYPHAQNGVVLGETPGDTVVVSPAYLRLTADAAVDWSIYANNGIRLMPGGSLAGIHPIEVVSDTVVHILGTPQMLAADIGQPVSVMIDGTIAVTKTPEPNLPPLQTGDKVYLSGTSTLIPTGPYQGRVQSTFGHKDQRAFDGVWTVASDEINNVFEIGYDSVFLLGSYTDPQPDDNTTGIPASYSRGLVSRINTVGTHPFDEVIFIGGYDILSDSTWRMRIFNTCNATDPGLTNLGVGGFFHYSPTPTTARAIVQVSGGSFSYKISQVVSAVPGFVSSYDNPDTEGESIAPPVKIGYANGIESQLNTEFTGADPPKGHAVVHANIEDGSIIPYSLASTGALVEGTDKDGNLLSYNIVSAYIPERVSNTIVSGTTRTLANTHRMRLILSTPYTTSFYGSIHITGVAMLNGSYDSPLPVEVFGATVDAQGQITCQGDSLPSIGDRVTSADIDTGKVVGHLVDNGNGIYVVSMYPPPTENSFVGQTDIVFETVSETVVYTPPDIAESGDYVPVQNSNIGSNNTVVPKGKWVRVPIEGTKTSHGTTPPTYDDGWILIPPRLPGRELEINAGAHVAPYAGSVDMANTPLHFYAHIGPDTIEDNISSFGPMSIGLTDGVLSVPTVCFPGARNVYNFTDMRVEYGGDYTTAPTAQFHADASMTVVDNNETRIGIVTHSDFHAFTKFRVIFEYNPNGLNGGKGFNDITHDGNIQFTFSRVYEPRLELLPEHTDKMAALGSHQKIKDMLFSYDVRNYDWPDSFRGESLADGHSLLSRQHQRLATVLGATENMFGQSAYIMPAQWNIDPVAYRLLLIEPYKTTVTAHTTLCTKVNDDQEGTISLGENSDNHNIFMKIVVPNAYNVQGPQPRMFSLQPPVYIEKIRVRIMDEDLTPYPFHGREFSLSLSFDGGKIVGRRNP